MSKVFDILFVLGVLANLLNLGDFLLRPSQKESFQRHMETAVLWLDYTRPITWLRRIGNMPAYWILLIALCLGSTGWILMNSTWATNLGRIIGLFMFVASVWSVLLVHLCRYTNIVFDYLTSNGKVSIFLLKSTGLFVLMISVNTLILYGIFLIEKSQNLWLNLLILAYYAICLYFARLILIATVSLPATMFMVSVMSFLFIMESTLTFVRSMCWRIVEFSKGAWSAIILLATVAIGLAKLLLSSS